jgi:hypothetical protein
MVQGPDVEGPAIVNLPAWVGGKGQARRWMGCKPAVATLIGLRCRHPGRYRSTHRINPGDVVGVLGIHGRGLAAVLGTVQPENPGQPE